MDEKKTTLEVIAPTVEEAIDKGLSELGLNPEDVEVEVLDEGKRNVFHFATRQARIRLTVKGANQSVFSQKEQTVEMAASQNITQQPVKRQATPQTDELTLEQQVVRDTTQELLEKMGVKRQGHCWNG